MEKEFLKETSRSVTLNVTGGKIDSFREKEQTTGTVRVYENGLIGVAGCLGNPDENELAKRASEALSLGIPYPCSLSDEPGMEITNENEIIPVSEFIPTMQDFLSRLEKECPRFAFSNKISLNYAKSEYENSLGRRLVSVGRNIDISLIAQNRGSGNLFDTEFCYTGSEFDPDLLLAEWKNEYDAFYTQVDIAPGSIPVVMNANYLFSTFLNHFSAEVYDSGASLLSGKLGQKVFSEKLTLKDDMNPKTNAGVCFFDTEGCVAPDLRPTLIDKGELAGLLTTKKTAERFKLQNIGTADAAYDGVPSSSFGSFYAEPTAKDLCELVPGRAVYVIITSGGDTTPDGHFSAPVQMAYLMENGKLVGRLPEFNIGGNFYDILGKDYIGAVYGDPLPNSMLCAVNMELTK